MQYSDEEDVDHVVGGVRGYSNATGQKLEFSGKAVRGLAAYRQAMLVLKDLFPQYSSKDHKYIYAGLKKQSEGGAEDVLQYLQSDVGQAAARGEVSGEVSGGFNFMDLFPVLQGVLGSGRGGIAVGGIPLGGIAVGGRKRKGGMHQTGYGGIAVGGIPLGGIALGGRKRKGGIALGGQRQLSGRTYCPHCQGSGFFDDLWSGIKDVGRTVGQVGMKVAPLLL